MSLTFDQTQTGKHFFNETMPRLVKALERIADSLSVNTEEVAAANVALQKDNDTLRDEREEALAAQQEITRDRDRLQTELIEARARLGEIDKTRPISFYDDQPKPPVR